MTSLLKDKLAVVTGASGDIGSAVATLLARHGAEVIATYNKGVERAKKVEAEAASKGLSVTTARLDVGDETEVKSFFGGMIDSRKQLDILVNVAGHSDRRIWYSKPEQLSSKDWLDVLNVDLVGSFNCSVRAAKVMLEGKGGSIVNFSSAAGVTGHTEGLPYTAAKAGIVAMTKSLAYLYGPKVRVNAVAPGNIRGGSIKWADTTEINQMMEEAALKRLGEPDEVANVVLFLASDLSSFITGQTLLVDGGI